MLKEAIENFRQPVYTKTARSTDTYASINNRCATQISRLVEEYNSVKNDQQLLREIRNEIDYQLRRYHNYCIKDRIGGHYRQKDLKHDDPKDFEHVLPAAIVRDLLLFGRISIEQAMNPPTCVLHREQHVALAAAGFASKTPDIWNFWQRYADLNIVIVTHDNQEIDTNSWNLGDHYRHFNIDA